MNYVKNILGNRYGALVVMKRSGSNARGLITWECKCDCGNTVIVSGAALRGGNPRSCGCIRGIKHGQCRRGKKGSEYYIWQAMIARCTRPKHKNFRQYGERGIKVCDRWRSSYSDFLSDMGPRPTPRHSIDRINNEGNYEPGNCRWATHLEQVNNSRHNRRLSVDGKLYSIKEVAAMVGLSYTWVAEQTRSGVSAQQLVDGSR